MCLAGTATHPTPMQRDRFDTELLAVTWSHPKHAETCLLDWSIQCRRQ